MMPNLHIPFLLLLAVTQRCWTLMCHNCKTINGGEVVCQSDCSGDYCVLWSDADERNMIRGCITGLGGNLTVGCRRNHVEATLCFCNDADGCNEQTLPEIMPPRKLPVVTCSDYVDAPYLMEDGAADTPPEEENEETARSCRSNFCFYHRNHVASNFAGQPEDSASAGCSHLPQFSFDVQVATIWPGPGALNNACYQLQAKGGDTTLGCMCSEDGCNQEQPFPLISGQVQCHLAYNVRNEDQLEADTCIGNYCIVQQTEDPSQNETRLMKGCISVSDPSVIGNGFRNILGIRQWLCDADRCNRDVASAQHFLRTGVVPPPAPSSTTERGRSERPMTKPKPSTATRTIVKSYLATILTVIIVVCLVGKL